MREHTANLCSSLVHFSRLPVALLVICIAKMSASFVHRIYPRIPWTRRWCVIKQITLLVLVYRLVRISAHAIITRLFFCFFIQGPVTPSVRHQFDVSGGMFIHKLYEDAILKCGGFIS